jgi:hypothetical protein
MLIGVDTFIFIIGDGEKDISSVTAAQKEALRVGFRG